MAAVAAANELQEQFLEREEQLSLREGELAMREVAVETTKRAIRVARMALNSERFQFEAIMREYHEKLRAQTTRVKVTIDLDKVLENKQVLKVWEVALCETLERGTHPWNDQNLLTELVELSELLTKVQVKRVGEAKELAVLMIDMSDALVDLGLDPNQWIPKVPRQA
jgi:hypothetical protein